MHWKKIDNYGRPLTGLDKGPKTGGLSLVFGAVAFISFFMYWGDGGQLMNGSVAAVVIFFLLMSVKCLSLSLTPFLHFDTHTCTHIYIHTFTL